MSKKAKRPLDIFSLTGVLAELSAALRQAEMIRGELVEGDLHAEQRTIERLLPLEGYDALLSHRRYDGHAMHLKHLRSSVARGRYGIADNHLDRLRQIVRSVSNDSPHRLKDRVWVNRYEHGWDVGIGTVTKVYGAPPENVSYEVTMDETDHPIYVQHTRDLSRAS